MKYIIALKRRWIIEICFWLLIVIGTYFLWDFKDFSSEANYYEDHSLISVIEDPVYEKIIRTVSDNKADFLSDYYLVLVNSTYRDENYNLYLGVSKDFDHSHLKIKDDSIRYVSSLANYEDADYHYYLLDTNSLLANQRVYQFSLYNDMSGENFVPYSIKFVVEKL